MTDRFQYQHIATRFSDRIEWLFFDSLLQDRVFLVFYFRIRECTARRELLSSAGNIYTPAWVPELKASLPPEAMAEAIGIALTLK